MAQLLIAENLREIFATLVKISDESANRCLRPTLREQENSKMLLRVSRLNLHEKFATLVKQSVKKYLTPTLRACISNRKILSCYSQFLV